MSFQTSALILSWVAILLLALVVSGLVQQVHALSGGAVRRPEQPGLPPGSPAPGLDRLAPDRPVPLLLLFLSEDCRTCANALDVAAGHAGRQDVAVRALYAGPAPASAADLPLRVHGEQADLFGRYDAIATPFAVVVDPTGRVVRSEPLGSEAALRTLLAQLTGPPADPAGAASTAADSANRKGAAR
jgi:hypothetical protein